MPIRSECFFVHCTSYLEETKNDLSPLKLSIISCTTIMHHHGRLMLVINFHKTSRTTVIYITEIRQLASIDDNSNNCHAHKLMTAMLLKLMMHCEVTF